MEPTSQVQAGSPDHTHLTPKGPSKLAREAYLAEPNFDQDEGLTDEDKVIADSFPASDPPAH
jgi:hypothetical protein